MRCLRFRASTAASLSTRRASSAVRFRSAPSLSRWISPCKGALTPLSMPTERTGNQTKDGALQMAVKALDM